MNIFKLFKYNFFYFLSFILSSKLIHLIGASHSTKWMRDKFFRPNGTTEIINKSIKYFGYTLKISSPIQVLYRAEKKGIESSLTRFIMNEVSNGDVCIDVGANYGFISMIMSKKVGFAGHVYAFEANRYIYKILKKNIICNNLDTICTLSNSFISNKSDESHKTIDEILLNDTKKIKLIKIDTDGTDYNCLLGARKIIKRDSPIIIIEVNDMEEDIYNQLKKIGYKFFYDQYYQTITSSMPPNLIASQYQLSKTA